MLLKAELTSSHKEDVRDQDQKILDSLIEKQNRGDKEPQSQFYGLVYQQEISTLNNTETLFGLRQDSNGFLILNTANIDYPAPNFQLIWDSIQSFSVNDIDIQTIESIRLNIFVNWYRRSNAATFTTNFSFDLFCVIAEVPEKNPETVQPPDYSPFLQINLGTINYNSITNTFSNLYRKLSFNLADLVDTQDFSGAKTVSKLTKNQYESLKNGEKRLSVYFGFRTNTLTPEALQYMFDRPFINRSTVNLYYKGLSKI